MPDMNETIRLGIDLGDSQAVVSRLTAEIEHLKSALRGATESFKEGTLAEEEFVKDAERIEGKLRIKEDLLKRVSGDEASGTGFAGAASNIMKAERAFTALATGSGLARAGPMLESVVASLGGAAGLGMAIGALAYGLEIIIPKLAKFFDIFDAEKVKAAAEALKKYAAESAALEAGGTKEDKATEKLVKEFLAGTTTTGKLAGAIESSGFQAQANAEETAKLERYRALGGALSPLAMAARATGGAMSPEDVQEATHQRNVQLAQKLVAESVLPGQRGAIARSQIRGFARDNPGAFPPGFEEQLRSLEPDALKEMNQIIAGETQAGKEQAAHGERIKEGIKLTKQGRDTEESWRKDMEREKERARKETEKAVADAERMADQIRRSEEQAANRARRAEEQAAKKAPLREAENYIAGTAQGMGVSLTAEQMAEAAKSALNAVEHNVNAQDAAIAAISQVVRKSADLQERIGQQAEAWRMIGQGVDAMDYYGPSTLPRGR